MGFFLAPSQLRVTKLINVVKIISKCLLISYYAIRPFSTPNVDEVRSEKRKYDSKGECINTFH